MHIKYTSEEKVIGSFFVKLLYIKHKKDLGKL